MDAIITEELHVVKPASLFRPHTIEAKAAK